MQLNWYPDLKLEKHDSDVVKEWKDEQCACYRRTREISEAMDFLIADLREYLEKLDVKDN